MDSEDLKNLLDFFLWNFTSIFLFFSGDYEEEVHSFLIQSRSVMSSSIPLHFFFIYLFFIFFFLIFFFLLIFGVLLFFFVRFSPVTSEVAPLVPTPAPPPR